jgi:hypothetical protein
MATKSPTQHHSYWGSFAGPGNLPNEAGAPVQDPALQEGDIAYESNMGVLYVCTDATLGAAMWAALTTGNSGPIWKWNETDLTQFGADLHTPVAGTITPSIDSSNAEGNRLILTMAAFEGLSVFPVIDVVSFPRRFVWFLRIFTLPAQNNMDGVLFAFAHNNGADAVYRGLHYYRSSSGGANYQARAYRGGAEEAGSPTGDSANIVSTEPGGWVEGIIEREPDPVDVSDGELDCSVVVRSFAAGGNSHDGSILNLDSIVWNADWTGETLNRIGYGFFANTAQNSVLSIASMAVFRHPMDL